MYDSLGNIYGSRVQIPSHSKRKGILRTRPVCFSLDQTSFNFSLFGSRRVSFLPSVFQMEIIFTYYLQSVTSFRSALISSSPVQADERSSIVVAMAGHSSDNEESAPSPISSPGMDNIQLLMDTIHQLTSDKEELQAHVGSLSQQLQQVGFNAFPIVSNYLLMLFLSN